MSDRSSRLRVMFVVDAFPGPDHVWDGVFYRDQAAALAMRADVAVVRPQTWSPRKWLSARGRRPQPRSRHTDGFDVFEMPAFVPTCRVDHWLVRARIRAVESAIRRFERQRGPIDILHAQCAAFCGETALAVGRRRDIPVVLTEHYSFLPDLVAQFGRRLLDVYDRVDRLFAVSKSLAERMTTLGVVRPIEWLPNAVDTVTFSPSTLSPPDHGPWHLLCVARDHPVKDVPTLVEAVASVVAAIDVRLTIVGGGEHKQARRLCNVHRLDDRVQFLGDLPRAALARCVRQSHLIVSSSRRETFGMSLAEALCTGRPVVATDSGGPRDIVTPLDGRLVPIANPEPLASAIVDVLQNYAQFDQRRIASSARARFGQARFAERLIAAYRELLDSRSARMVLSEGPRGKGTAVCRSGPGGIAAGAESEVTFTEASPTASGMPATCAEPTAFALSTSVVIATRNRADDLERCLDALAVQTLAANEIIVADASTDDATERVVTARQANHPSRLDYFRCRRPGAAAQRNDAMDRARGEIVFFLDDDVECEPAFVAEIVRVFASDGNATIGGVSGTQTNERVVLPSRCNRWFMRWMAGYARDEYGGCVIGPAWNHLPLDTGEPVRDVDWLPTTCVAYRADVVKQLRFNETFGEYAYAEDVHLSTRVRREKRVVHAGLARAFHHDLGIRSHGRPRELGRAQVVNRWIIMRDVLLRCGTYDRFKLAALQGYFAAAEVRRCLARGGWRRMWQTWHGRIDGLRTVFRET